MKSMTAEAIALTNVLLKHHKLVCPGATRSLENVDEFLIPYRTLCDRAGVPHLTRAVGNFLEEVAEWCQEHDWPPINSLAVNQNTRMPGEGYDLAAGCSLIRWPDQVNACIIFDRYPDTI